MKLYEVKMRRKIIEIYEIEAKSEEEARQKAEDWDHNSPPQEIDQEDYEVLSVKESK